MKKWFLTQFKMVVFNADGQDVKVKTFIHDLMERMTIDFFYRNAN